MHAEQRALAHGLVADVGVGMIVRRQRVAFVMIQSIAIGGHTGHEDIALQIVAAGARRGFHLGGGGAALPIVDVVVDDIEILAGQSALQSFRIIAVGHDVADLFSQIVARLPVQNGNFVPGVQQFLHQRPADEQRSADHQNFLSGGLLPFRSVSRSTQAQGV